MGGSFLSSLRVRLVVLVLIAALPAFGIVLWNNFEQRRDKRENAEALAQKVTEATAAQEAQVLQSARELLSRLAVAPQVTDGDVTACYEYLAGVLAIEPRYAGFSVANPRGDISCWSIDANPQLNVADRAYFQRVTAGREFAVGDYILARDGAATPVLSFAYPMFDDQGQLVGMMATGVKLDWLNEFSSRFTLPEGATLNVIDRNGVVLARQPDPEGYVGKVVPETPLVERVLAEGTGTAEVLGLDRIEKLYAFAPMGGGSGAFVAFGVPASTAYAGINRTLTRNLALLGAAALLALLAAWFGGEWFVLRGMRALVGAARRVGVGDLNARTGLGHDRGEVGQLARTFDQMAEALELREAARREAGEQLRQSEERFRSMVSFSADGIVMSDAGGRIVLANQAAERMFGYGADELVGQSIEALMPEHLRQSHTTHRAGYVGQATPRPMGAGLDLRGLRKDGSAFPVDISLSPLRTAEGVLVAAAVRDISERKLMEEQLNATVTDLSRSNAELEQFAYVASHDLQEPLRMVSNYTQLLARRYQGQLDSDADEFISYAVDGAKRMQALINDLLAFSRVGTRGKPPEPASCDDILEKTLKGLQPLIDESGAHVTRDSLPTVPVDDVQLSQLLQNLIANAIKFRRDEPPCVHISAERDGGQWVFSFRDNGIGIDPPYHERIFVLFQRLHGREEYPGTGIGLAICKKIVERHGGRIWVESVPGEGSTFRFTLPAAADGRLAAAESRAAA